MMINYFSLNVTFITLLSLLNLPETPQCLALERSRLRDLHTIEVLPRKEGITSVITEYLLLSGAYVTTN